MEGKKVVGSSSSSSSSSSSTFRELFGSKESPSSTTGIFGSLFGPTPKVLGRGSLRPDVMTKKQDSPNEPWKAKPNGEASGISYNAQETEKYQSKVHRDVISSIYQEQRVPAVQPCNLSSSIYYGGQDYYYCPKASQSSGMSSMDVGEDESGYASRGNWWKGSLYY